MRRASKVVEETSTDKLLDILEANNRQRAELAYKENLGAMEKNLQKMVDDFKKTKGYQEKPWKFNSTVKIGLSPSVTMNVSREFKNPFKRGEKTPDLDKELKNQFKAESGEKTIIGKITPKLIEKELESRGITEISPITEQAGERNLTIRDHDLTAQGDLREGIKHHLNEENSRGNYNLNPGEKHKPLEKIEVQTSKPISLSNLQLKGTSLESKSALKLEDVTFKEIKAPKISGTEISTSGEISVKGDLKASEVKASKLEVGGNIEAKSVNVGKLKVGGDFEAETFQARDAQVSGDLVAQQGKVNDLAVKGTTHVKGNLEVTRKAEFEKYAAIGNVSGKGKVVGEEVNVAEKNNQKVSEKKDQGRKF